MENTLPLTFTTVFRYCFRRVFGVFVSIVSQPAGSIPHVLGLFTFMVRFTERMDLRYYFSFIVIAAFTLSVVFVIGLASTHYGLFTDSRWLDYLPCAVQRIN